MNACGLAADEQRIGDLLAADRATFYALLSSVVLPGATATTSAPVQTG